MQSFTLSDISWLGNVFTVIAAIFAIFGAILTQFVVANLTRQREKFSQLRKAYAKFASYAYDFGDCAVRVATSHKLGESVNKPGTPQDIITEWTSSNRAMEQELDVANQEFRSLFLRIVLLETNPERRDDAKRHYEKTRKVFWTRDHLRSVGRDSDMNFIVGATLNDLETWLFGVSESVHKEEDSLSSWSGLL
jgi:hypothetical protein